MEIKNAPFVPEGFMPKEIVEQPDFVLRKLCYSDAELDYQAVMSSIELIKRIRGGNWPSSDLTFEDDLIDLAWHQREFEFGTSFAYTVLSPNREKIIGCIYIYPTNKPWLKPPADADAVVNMWITQEVYDNGLYPKLFSFVKSWVSKEWPFKNPYFSNKEIPKEE